MLLSAFYAWVGGLQWIGEKENKFEHALLSENKSARALGNRCRTSDGTTREMMIMMWRRWWCSSKNPRRKRNKKMRRNRKRRRKPGLVPWNFRWKCTKQEACRASWCSPEWRATKKDEEIIKKNRHQLTSCEVETSMKLIDTSNGKRNGKFLDENRRNLAATPLFQYILKFYLFNIILNVNRLIL